MLPMFPCSTLAVRFVAVTFLVICCWISNAVADTSISLGSNNRIWLKTQGADDELVCEINGSPLVQIKFGDPGADVEFYSKLKSGANKLTCRALDRPEDGGGCFAFGYSIVTGTEKGGAYATEHTFSTSSSCCAAWCARTNPVHEATIWLRVD